MWAFDELNGIYFYYKDNEPKYGFRVVRNYELELKCLTFESWWQKNVLKGIKN